MQEALGRFLDRTEHQISCYSRQANEEGEENQNQRSPKETDQLSVFVSILHARMYTIADKYDIKGLATLALDEQYIYLLMLIAGDYTKNQLPNIMELIKYVFEHTTSYKEDPMRKMIMGFLACQMHILRGTDELLDLLEEGGEFARCFGKLVIPLLTDPRAE
jgi:hypothetical protein